MSSKYYNFGIPKYWGLGHTSSSCSSCKSPKRSLSSRSPKRRKSPCKSGKIRRRKGSGRCVKKNSRRSPCKSGYTRKRKSANKYLCNKKKRSGRK